MRRELPPRKPQTQINNVTNQQDKDCFISFTDFVNKSCEELIENKTSEIYIADKGDNRDVEYFNHIYANKDLFDKLINKLNTVSISRCLTIISENYKILEILNLTENLSDKIHFNLLDDFQNKYRNDIDCNKFTRHDLVIPASYCMWMDSTKLKDGQKTAYFYRKNDLNPILASGNSYNASTFKTIKKIIEELTENLDKKISIDKLDEVDKTILISNYFQNLVQYVNTNNRSEGPNGIYITDSKEEIVGTNVTYPENVLVNHYGICAGIGNATTLLMNNPLINMNVRSTRGDHHVWNIVNIAGKNYFIDNTWCISRNKHQYPDSLKAEEFSSDYLLFGLDTAKKINYHIATTFLPNVEQNDYNQEEIKNKIKILSKTYKFNDYNKPVFASRLEKNNN